MMTPPSFLQRHTLNDAKQPEIGAGWPDDGVNVDRASKNAKWIAGIVTCLLIAGVAFLGWSWNGSASYTLPVAAAPLNARLATMQINPQPVVATIDIVGVVGPTSTVPVIVPFDGIVREKHFDLGVAVQQGESLLVLDPGDIMGRYRDAQSAFLRAAIARQELDDWESGPEVLRARRSVEAGEASLAVLQRQVDETNALLERGIVARSEYNTLVEQRDAQILNLEGARDDHAAILDRANSERRELLDLDLENTRARVAELQAQLDRATILAPASGIVVRPPNPGTTWSASVFEPGASLTKSGAVVSIADTSQLVISGFVDEIDVNQIQIGQSVQIESDAFGRQALPGVIVDISSEARPRDSGVGPAMFEIRAEFEAPDDETRTAIRLGMTAKMIVTVYENRNALLVPPNALVATANGPIVRMIASAGLVDVPVVTGRSFAPGIEILSGLAVGAEIAMAGEQTNPSNGVPDLGGLRNGIQPQLRLGQ